MIISQETFGKAKALAALCDRAARKRAEVSKLNAPIRAYNDEVGKANAALCAKMGPKKARASGKLKARKAHAHRMPAQYEQVLSDEKLTQLELHMIDGAEWARRIEDIEVEALRHKAALIVYWDFFGDRAVSERWDHLDKYIRLPSAPVGVLEDDLAAALLWLGYPARMAFSRSKTPNDTNTTAEAVEVAA